MTQLPKVNRVEVIDHRGRSYTLDPRAYPGYDITVSTDFQDDGRTLKIFISVRDK